MRAPLALAILGLGLLGSGCALLSDSVGQADYQERGAAEDFCARQRNRRGAEDAWTNVCQVNHGAPYSEDYHRGYADGFSDYLYKGGTGAPPVVPPARYRPIRYQSAQGYLELQDWYAGYRHGAAEAQRSGYRPWATGPTSLAEPVRTGPAASRLGEPAASGPAEPLAPQARGHTLPPPEPKQRKTDIPPEAGPYFPKQQAPVVPGPALPEKADAPLVAEDVPLSRNPGLVALVTLAALSNAPPASPLPTGGITLRPLLPAFADYEVQLRPAPWLAELK